MNVSILLRNIASVQANIENLELELEIARRSQAQSLQKLGELLRAGLDQDNFPLRLQLNKYHEVRVCDSILEADSYNIVQCMHVCRTENLEQADLMRLLEAIEE
ncbi:hypothetical protein [uncultured Marinobacter sp.]|uniref:hypothetical protein n=1 Tax=uncultured Marinobacter sp. TaxID=187379 RepID=UPI00258B097E|nr:hypothetical protein [uncultured Marinobacter sp.]